MPQAQADPEEMERFARTLKQFTNDLGNRTSALKQQFAQLGSTWRDQEYARYAPGVPADDDDAGAYHA